MANRVTSSGRYEEALSIMCEYIEPVNQDYQKVNDIDNFDIDI